MRRATLTLTYTELSAQTFKVDTLRGGIQALHVCAREGEYGKGCRKSCVVLKIGHAACGTNLRDGEREWLMFSSSLRDGD